MAVGRAQPPTQFVAGLFPGDVKLTTYIHPLSRLRMRGAIRLLHNIVFWRLQEHLYLYVLLYVVTCSYA